MSAISHCCGAPPHPHFSENICSECKEHTEFYENELEQLLDTEGIDENCNGCDYLLEVTIEMPEGQPDGTGYICDADDPEQCGRVA